MRKNISSIAPVPVHNAARDMQTALLHIIILYYNYIILHYIIILYHYG